MSDKRIRYLANAAVRQRVLDEIRSAEDGSKVTLEPPGRTISQNDKFHAMCTDIAKAGVQWAGKKRKAVEWKVLLVSGHAVATKEGSEVVPGLEGEFVNIRESTAAMSKRRGASLIEYTQAFMAANGVRFTAPEEAYA